MKRLSIFQRTMLTWNHEHAYNAVHVVRIAAPLEPRRLGRLLNETWQAARLTNLQLTDRRWAFLGGPAELPLTVLSNQGDVQAALDAEITRHLNTGFSGVELANPFRFFVAPENGDFYLGLVYGHFVASAESVTALLRQVAAAYTDPENTPALQPFAAGPPPWSKIRLALVYALPWLVATVGQLRLTLTAARPKYCHRKDLNIGFAALAVTTAPVAALRHAARAGGFTLNDLFLAALIKALRPFAEQRFRGRRRKIAVAAIVNVRRDLGVNGQAFGLMLGSFMVAHGASPDIPLEQIARDINRQTRRIKRYKLYLRTLSELTFAAWFSRWFSPDQRRRMFPKHYPLFAGISNVNLNQYWSGAEAAGFDYRRAVSTGPISPLVLSITSVGERLNIGVSYRHTVYQTEDIEQIMAAFTTALEQAVASIPESPGEVRRAD